MITWQNRDNEIAEGCFKSRIFKNEDEDFLFICLEKTGYEDYAEKCVDMFNSLDDDTIDTICEGIIKCAEEGGLEEDFELPELDDVRDILDFCWFTTVYVSAPKDESKICFAVEGEGEWGEVVGFVIKDGKVTYVGTEFFDEQ
jgi:hypothetical protein